MIKIKKKNAGFGFIEPVCPCVSCDKVPISPSGNKNQYMFIGAYPGLEEEKQGQFWVGESGQWLKTVLHASGINPDTECWFSNIFKCRLLDENGKQRQPSDADYRKCGSLMVDEVLEVNPKVIILMGDVALKFFFGKSKISLFRGQVLEKGDYKFIATFNPAHLTREKDKENSNDVRLFRQDIKRVYNLYNGIKTEDIQCSYKVAETEADVLSILGMLKTVGKFTLDIETFSPKKVIIINGKKKNLKTALDPWSDEFRVELISFSYKDKFGRKAFAIPLEHPESKLNFPWVLQELKWFFKGEYQVSGQNIKFDTKIIKVRYGIDVNKVVFDTLPAHALLVGTGYSHNLQGMSQDYLGLDTYKDVLGSKDDKGSVLVPIEDLSIMSMKDCVNTTELAEIFEKDLKRDNLWDYYNRFIIPGIPTLMRMEVRGMKVDLDYIHILDKEIQSQLDELRHKIISYPEIAGKSYKITSNVDLQKILFEDFKFPTGRKTKTGFSVDKDLVEKLYANYKHPFLKDLTDFRLLEKIHNTYVLPYILAYIKKDGRVHGTINQHVTLTGRLSMENPNLQNLPVKIGGLIMQMFDAPSGWKLMLADYNQIELRIMAVASHDEKMLRAFREGKDIHKATASEAFGIPFDEVTKEQRQEAKGINFGIIYGITEIGLAEYLNIAEEVAKVKIDSYLDNYSGVKGYMDKCISDYKQFGYVETLFGRRIYIKGGNRGHNERLAVNGPIQGTAADICNKASHECDSLILKEELEMGMIDTIHDALAFEVPEIEQAYAPEIIKPLMENVDISFMKNYDLMKSIGLKVDISVGNNLSEAKG